MKKSIRQFVNENDIRFELYHMKYTNQLKQLSQLSQEEIQIKWDYDNNKKAKRYRKELLKPQNSNEIAQTALKHNIEYVLSTKPPLTKEKINKDFIKRTNEYIDSLKERLRENEENPGKFPLPPVVIKKIKDTLIYTNKLKKKGITEYSNKERFGAMLLLMIKNLSTMPSFSGYSDNWKTDFYSNAVEKTILYLNNFDEELLSKRTGKKSKAFAYVTQICFNAFVDIINTRKAEQVMLKDTISYETHNFDGIRNLLNESIKDDFSNKEKLTKKSTYIVEITNKDDLNTIINKSIKKIEESNNTLMINNSIEYEIEELNKIPDEEKNKDYFGYIEDLKDRIKPIIFEEKIKTLLLLKDCDFDLNIPDNFINSNKEITIIISKSKEMLEVKKEIKKELNKKEIKAKESIKLAKKEEEEFNDEW